MSYYNNEIDFGKIIKEANRKEREKWRKINDYCEKNRKNQVELVREAVERIKRDNRRKFDKINDRNTSDGERAAILTEYILTKMLMALTGHVYTLHKPSNKKGKIYKSSKKRRKK